jgi:hypothetical protein
VVAAIKGRPAHETLESLRLTLLKVEQSADPEQDAEALAELKRILLQRIAELEAIQALESAAAEIVDKPNPEDLILPASVTVEDSKEIMDSKDIIMDADPSTPPPEPE